MLELQRSFRFALTLVTVLTIAACGGEAGDEGADADTEAGAEAAAVEIANPGVITGVVNFEGSPPAPEPIDMSEEQACAEKHEGQPMKHAAVVNDNNTLRNVFVYVKEGLQQDFPAPAEAAVLDQEGCIYEPHVFGMQAGQALVIQNSDGVLHNINATPDQNRGFNRSQPGALEEIRLDSPFPVSEIMIPVRCDVHGWMEAYVGVVDHPYYAVTGEDGSFRIENLPPGDYVVEAWHERYGTQTANVSVAPDGTAETSFSYNAGMAATARVPLGKPFEPHVAAGVAHGHGGR